jgi:hypothetical protein
MGQWGLKLKPIPENINGVAREKEQAGIALCETNTIWAKGTQ